jgi:hypothetical protein
MKIGNFGDIKLEFVECFHAQTKALAFLMYIISHPCFNTLMMMMMIYSSLSEPLTNVFGIESPSE